MQDEHARPAIHFGNLYARDIRQVAVLVGVLLIIALGFELRIFRLYDQSYWGDEVISMVVARYSPLELINWIKDTAEPHPPLYYLMLSLWTQIVGQNELATRYLSVAFGTLSIALIFIVGKTLFGRRPGIAGALLLATNPFNVLHSRDARMYSILVFFTLLSTVIMLFIARERSSSRLSWAAYIITCALGLFLHYYFVFVLAAQVLFMTAESRLHWKSLRRWVVAWTGVALAYAPWLIFAGSVLFTYQGFTWSPAHFGADTLGQAFWDTTVEFSGAKGLEDEFWIDVATALACCLLLLGAVIWTRRSSRKAFLLSLIFLLPILSVYLASLRRPIFLPRYLISASAAFLLIIAGNALVMSKRRWVSLVSVAALTPMLVSSIFSLANSYFDPNLANPDYRSAAGLVKQSLRQGDGFVFGHSGVKLQFTYYFGSEPVHYFPPGKLSGNEAEIDSSLTEMLRVFDRVWFIPYWKSDTDLYMEDWLDRHAYKVQNQFVGKVKVVLYSSPRKEPTHNLVNRQIPFANGLSLETATIVDTAASPGEAFDMEFSWQLQNKLDQNLKAALRMVDDTGYVYSAVDRRIADQATTNWLPGQRLTERRGLLVEPGTPPGDYRMEMVLYREEDGRPVDAVGEDGQSRVSVLRLGTVHVVRGSTPPSTESLPLKMLLGAQLSDDIRLLGATVDRTNVKPGERATVTAFWQATRDVPADYVVSVRAADKQGSAGELATTPVRGLYPTSWWTAGEIIRDHYSLIISPKASAGRYDVSIGLSKQDSGSKAAPEKEVVIGTLNVSSKERNFTLPAPSHPMTTDFGNSVRLLGYDLTESQNPRGIQLTLYWQALHETDASYTVFTHLLDAQQKVVGQSDSVPVSGTNPTSSWVTGEVITDRYEIPLQAGTLSGSYAIEVGLYDAATGTRLKRDGGEDRIILQAVFLP